MSYLERVQTKLSISWALFSFIGAVIAVLLAVGLDGRGEPSQQPPDRDFSQFSVGFGVVEQDEGEGDEAGEGAAEEPPPLTAIGLTEVVIARTTIPLGQRIRADLLETELRPADNLAIRAGWTFDSADLVVGEIAKTDIAKGQAIHRDMLALSPTDLTTIGSDLALHVEDGRVAIALPINQYSGAAYAMRPGDFVDILMSFNLIELDVDFQTQLPNITELVDEQALQNGERFLLAAITQGRLELIPEVGAVAQITPRGINLEQDVVGGTISSGDTIVQQEPRRVTQLTLQKIKVLWVGDWLADGDLWQGPNNFILEDMLAEAEDSRQLTVAQQRQLADEFGIFVGSVESLRALQRSRLQAIGPDVVILSMPVQDALAVKWALEEPGINLTTVLRSQGDATDYFTTSVSLPQLVEQAGLSIPEPSQFGLEPYVGSVPIERLSPFSDFDPGLLQGPQ